MMHSHTKSRPLHFFESNRNAAKNIQYLFLLFRCKTTAVAPLGRGDKSFAGASHSVIPTVYCLDYLLPRLYLTAVVLVFYGAIGYWYILPPLWSSNLTLSHLTIPVVTATPSPQTRGGRLVCNQFLQRISHQGHSVHHSISR